MPIPETASAFLAGHVERLRQIKPKKRIVFPEGGDRRVIAAAARLAQEGLLDPILIGPKPSDAPPGVCYVEADAKYAPLYYERRRAKGITSMEAAKIASLPLYYAALMVSAGDADGYVGGAANTTAETVRAALHCIGTQPKVRTVSSVFFIAVPDSSFGHRGILAMADCAIVIDPNPVELAEIAIATAQSVRTLLNVEPTVALLSFSTKGSGKHPLVNKVAEAMRIVRERAPQLHVDGELQADAALVPEIGQSKAPGSTVAGQANTLIFPDLASANIGYKLVERLAHGAAIGPFLQGLAKPANDLSRGCSANDVYSVAVITALQSCSPSH
jgi:phosphate acetyltransferase